MDTSSARQDSSRWPVSKNSTWKAEAIQPEAVVPAAEKQQDEAEQRLDQMLAQDVDCLHRRAGVKPAVFEPMREAVQAGESVSTHPAGGAGAAPSQNSGWKIGS